MSGPSGPAGPGGNAAAAAQFRPLNVKDALTYLDQVKIQFMDQPEVYNRFLDIMKFFKSQSIDTPGVIERVSTLFRGHPSLITGFNTFLPPGYRIEPTSNPLEPVKVTTPTDPIGHPPGYREPPQPPPQPQPHPQQQTSPSPPPPPGPEPPPGMMMPGIIYTPFGGPPQYHPAGGPNMGQPGGPVGMQQPQGPPPPPSSAPPNGYPGPPQPIQPSSMMPSGHGPVPTPQMPPQQASQPPAARPDALQRRAPVEFNHAINYVNKIKNRFASEPETYKNFLEILQTYQKESKPIQEVYAQVQVLFKNATDLLDEFKQFLPDNSNQNAQQRPAPGGMPVLGTMPNGMAEHYGGQSKRSAPGGGPGHAHSSQGGPGKKGTKRAAGSSAGMVGGPMSGLPSGSSSMGGMSTLGATQAGLGNQPPKKKVKAANVSKPEKPSTLEELEFFDRVKRAIANKATYNEFLKVLNLFSQEIIDAKTLVERVEPFLGRHSDLFKWFKEFVKYEDDQYIVNQPAERSGPDLTNCRQSGHSYRMLPQTEKRPICSGRDALCNEVLNDDWISSPVYLSETGFVSHRKTQYEETLYRCEEERYEFDRHIEANLHTIALLEPIAKKISGMSAEEKSRFKLPPGLGGFSTTIYQRAIKKIYDKERAQEILDALHNNPVVAVPVVLKRLKQKDEEWKRAQREWNKVWREIEMKNFYKALDHQGVTFKKNDTKALNMKSLVTEIESIYREQREDGDTTAQPPAQHATTTTAAANSSSSTSSTRYQFDFQFKDKDLFRDVKNIILEGVDAGSVNPRHIRGFLNSFVKKFFWVEDIGGMESEDDSDSDDDDDGAGSQRSVDTDTEMEDGETSSGGGGRSSSGRSQRNASGGNRSLRKNVLLRNNKVAATNGVRGGDRSKSPSTSRRSRRAASAASDAMDTDDESSGHQGSRRTGAGVKEEEGGNSHDSATDVKREPADEHGGAADDEMMLDRDHREGSVESGEGHLQRFDRRNGSPASVSTTGTAVPRSTYAFYSNTTFYVFFRLYQMLYSRLLKMKELSEQLANHPPSSEKLNPVAVELGLKKPESGYIFNNKDRYQDLLENIREWFDGKLESNEFEERSRTMFQTSGYLTFTFDKLTQAIIRQIRDITSDPRCLELTNLYYKDREKPTTSSKQEAVYRLAAEAHVQDENIFRMEFFSLERVMTIQLLGKDDQLSDDTYSSEEKWSLYVDHFVQVSDSETVQPQQQVLPPFLQRNLPPTISEDPPADVEARGGLELKICVNTYKIFFVDNTEDYFRRKKAVSSRAGFEEGKEIRSKKFRQWLTSRSGVFGPGAGACENWFLGNGDAGSKGGMKVVIVDEPGKHCRMFVSSLGSLVGSPGSVPPAQTGNSNAAGTSSATTTSVQPSVSEGTATHVDGSAETAKPTEPKRPSPSSSTPPALTGHGGTAQPVPAVEEPKKDTTTVAAEGATAEKDGASEEGKNGPVAANEVAPMDVDGDNVGGGAASSSS
ncbi:Transcriptional regulatory protein sin3 [Quaeritorhiza haematococci]|nr:Transcriptional regulatory protein sin3 [Quaeritorhiza haematococci]